MRLLIQRVKSASVKIGDKHCARINHGLMVLVGFSVRDEKTDFDFWANKLINLRIFDDDNQKMNLSLKDVKGELLLVSQFTLYADTRKGRRPGYSDSAPGPQAQKWFDVFLRSCKNIMPLTQSGVFGEHMLVELQNNGPVTIMLDSDL